MDAVLGIFNNPLVLMVLGVAMKRFPGLRTVVANRLIPTILAAVAWASSIVARVAAHAAAGPWSLDPPPHAAGLFGALVGGLGSAVIQAGKAWAMHEMFARHWLGPKPADSR